MAVRMRHPDLDGEIVVASSAVPIHRGSGWEPVEGQDDMGEVWPAELQRFEGQPPVRMRHPNVQDEITVASSAVPYHRSVGWLEVTADAEPETQSKPARKARGKKSQEEAEQVEAAEQTSKEE